MISSFELIFESTLTLKSNQFATKISEINDCCIEKRIFIETYVKSFWDNI